MEQIGNEVRLALPEVLGVGAAAVEPGQTLQRPHHPGVIRGDERPGAIQVLIGDVIGRIALPPRSIDVVLGCDKSCDLCLESDGLRQRHRIGPWRLEDVPEIHEHQDDESHLSPWPGGWPAEA